MSRMYVVALVLEARVSGRFLANMLGGRNKRLTLCLDAEVVGILQHWTGQ